MSLVNRAMNIITKPREEWAVVAAETPNTSGILMGYVLPLALIPAVAQVIGWGVIGNNGVRAPMGGAIGQGVVTIIAAIVGVLLGAAVCNALAPTFKARQDFGRAVQLVAYSMTPTWIVGILSLITPVTMIAVSVGSLYGFYLLYLGLSPVMETPVDQRFPHLFATWIGAFVLFFVVQSFLASIILGLFGVTLMGASGQ